jgi:hypothetical protein
MSDSSPFEHILEEALRFLESGKSQTEVFERFPEYRKELIIVFQKIERLSAMKKTIRPRRELLSTILSKIEHAPVSGLEEAQKGRVLFTNFQIHKFMNMQMKVVLPLVLIVLAGGIVFYANNRPVSPLKVAQNNGPEATNQAGSTDVSSGTNSSNETKTTMKVASSISVNPDDIVNDIFSSYAAEEALQNDVALDGDFATYDSALVSEFGQFNYE